MLLILVFIVALAVVAVVVLAHKHGTLAAKVEWMRTGILSDVKYLHKRIDGIIGTPAPVTPISAGLDLKNPADPGTPL